jgi:hypothetical protein
VTDTITINPVSVSPAEDAVVTVMKGAVGGHVGLLYRTKDDETRRHLHLAWHYSLQNDSAPPSEAFWVKPQFDELELADVRASARLIAQRRDDGRVPYALRSADARFDRAGTLQLNQSLGLTCASFIVLVFAHAGITLLESETWEQNRSDERKREDEAAQKYLVDYLRKEPDSRDHAERVDKEVPCTRVRAEEVAAASGMTGHPIPFTRAEPQGRVVLGVIQAPSKTKRVGLHVEEAGAAVGSPADS